MVVSFTEVDARVAALVKEMTAEGSARLRQAL